jgi:ABC-2 type transport system permease protein
MTAVAAWGGERTSAPTFGRLAGTELRRLAARRFTQVLLGVCVLGYLIAVAYLFQNYAKPTAADFAQATAQRDEQIQQIAASTKECLAAPGGSEQNCGSVPTAAEFPVDQFLSNTPFRPGEVADYTVAVGVAVAMAGFALAATFIGAEWSSRNIVAWLFYEPRRLRLLGAKLLAVTGAVLMLSIFAQLVWALTARWLLSSRGLPVSSLGADGAHFWSDLLGVQVRAAVLVLPTVWLGFGLANLIRNTAAALGIAFVYFVVLESVVRAINPALQPYLFTTAVGAWVTHGGVTVDGAMVFNQKEGFVMPEQIHVSNLQGAVTLLVYAGVVLGVSVAMFRARDIT